MSPANLANDGLLCYYGKFHLIFIAFFLSSLYIAIIQKTCLEASLPVLMDGPYLNVARCFIGVYVSIGGWPLHL